MSIREVTDLCKSGKLDEALEMANQALVTDPENIWNKRAAAWVYYYHLKKFSQSDSFDAFKENLLKIKDLKLPEDEKMVFDNSAWQIGSMVFGLQKEEHVAYKKINTFFEIIKEFHFTKPSVAYTFIYKAFHKGYQNWSKYLEFADWWNFENFRPEDYLKEELNDKRIMAIAEQAYIAYSKCLLDLDNKNRYKIIEIIPLESSEEPSSNSKIKENSNNKENKIQQFLPKLNKIIEEHPEYQYPSYYKAKLLLTLGNKENTLSSFLPFAKQKKNEFWVWQLMAEIFPEDKETQFACYCKALSLPTLEDFLVKIRQTFAEMLVERQMYSEAKTEIQKVIATREAEKWKLPNQITRWTNQDWYKSATPKKDNNDLYFQHVKKAEEILFQDIPEEVVAVEFVNENKELLSFVRDRRKFGFFNYSDYLDKPQIGELLKVRFKRGRQGRFYKILSARKADSNVTSQAIKDYQGSLEVIPPYNFGFADDVFIESKFIQHNNLSDGQTLSGKAILSFNKKKKEWGWKGLTVTSYST